MGDAPRRLAGWLRGRRSPSGCQAWLLVWGTVPAGLLGFLLRHRLVLLFGQPRVAAVLLMVNGVLMFGLIAGPAAGQPGGAGGVRNCWRF
ncbi:MAG: hypothetical protein OWV35_00350 [Firmicutes bacterium]|nr:hypothetical protein [Bacillota bacterium]